MAGPSSREAKCSGGAIAWLPSSGIAMSVSIIFLDFSRGASTSIRYVRYPRLGGCLRQFRASGPNGSTACRQSLACTRDAGERCRDAPNLFSHRTGALRVADLSTWTCSRRCQGYVLPSVSKQRRAGTRAGRPSFTLLCRAKMTSWPRSRSRAGPVPARRRQSKCLIASSTPNAEAMGTEVSTRACSLSRLGMYKLRLRPR